MGLQKSGAIKLTCFLAVICLVLATLGYWVADKGFGMALESKADTDSSNPGRFWIWFIQEVGSWKVISFIRAVC